MSFNSTLVQLKRGSDSGGSGIRPVFQFHIGSIKNKIYSVLYLSFSMFQFHIGSIKNKPQIEQRSFERVSIPHWFN